MCCCDISVYFVRKYFFIHQLINNRDKIIHLFIVGTNQATFSHEQSSLFLSSNVDWSFWRALQANGGQMHEERV